MTEKITTWERLVLVGMYLASCRAKEPLQVEFTRRAIEHICWFDWHGYHTKRMAKMAARGWVVAGHTEDGLIAYRMTKQGHGQVALDLGNALANIRYVPEGQLDLI